MYTCLVELGLAVVFLLPLDVGRGERLRGGVDAEAEAALAAVAKEIDGAWSVDVDVEGDGDERGAVGGLGREGGKTHLPGVHDHTAATMDSSF